MEKDYQKCISQCDRGSYCAGYDCFKAGYKAGFKNQKEVLDSINKAIEQAKIVEQELKKLMEAAEKKICLNNFMYAKPGVLY
jgi:hypothetical protein